MDKAEQKFQDELAAKLYAANKRDADKRANDLLNKLSQLIPKEIPQAPSFPDEIKIKGVEFIKGNQGEKGDTGEKGEMGTSGQDGKNGKDGINGRDGINGKDGRNGIDGIDGLSGKDGAKGEKGDTGTFDSETLGQIKTGLESMSFLPRTLDALFDVNLIVRPTNNQTLVYNATLNKWVAGSASGGSGATSFIQLTDVPNSYSGQGGKAIRVNAGETGLEFFTAAGSGTVTSVASADGSITVTNPTTTVDLAVVKAPKWSTARLLAGNSVDGSANVAFANKFIVQGTTDTGLSAAQFLGALASGYVKNTTTTGVLSTVSTIPASDISSGAALTKTDDTNVTLTLGGTPATALLAATSLTLGWTGQLSVARGGTGATAFTQGSVVFAGASGVYTQDNANFFWDATNHFLGVGTAAPDTRFTASLQNTIVAPVSGSTAHYIGLDANPLRITYDTHNNASSSGTALMFRRSRGTAGTPSAVQSGDVLASLNARGYGVSQYAAASTGVLSWKANQAFTNTANGTYLSIDTTPDGSVTAAEVARFTATGMTIGVAGTLIGQISFSGNTSGVTILQSLAAASGTLTLPSATDTLVGKATTDIFTNKTLTASTNVLGGVTMTLGSDANGDTYYRASSVLTRLAIGVAGQVYTVNAGATAPSWAYPSQTSFAVAQTTHGFSVGNIIRSNGTANQYTKSQSNSSSNAEVVGYVTVVVDANNFVYVTEGIVTTGVPTNTAGTVYFLDPSSAGALTATGPTTSGQVNKPLLTIIQSATVAYFHNYRGALLSAATITPYDPTVGGTGVANNVANTITFSGNFGLTLTLSAGTSVTLPTSGTLATRAGTETLTNKRNQPRVISAASYTTDTGTSLDVSTTDLFVITAQAGALKFNNPGGTPVQGEKLMIRIKDNATARALTYDTQFRASSDLALPTTTILSKTLYMGFVYNSTDTKWDLIAVLNNFT